MALGKNLKKRLLLPSEGKPPTTSRSKRKSEINIGGSSKKAKDDIRKTTKGDHRLHEIEIISPSSDITQEISRKSDTEKINFPGKILEKRSKYVTEEEYNERQRLNSKFDEELESLIGKKVHLIVFTLGNSQYAIEIDYTREVVVTPPISKTPHAPHYIKGVATVRGLTMVVMDLAEKFNINNTLESDLNNMYIMVLESDKYDVGVLIKKVPTTMVVRGEEIGSSAGIMTDTALDKTYIKGLIRKNDQMIFFIDIDELIEGDKINVIP